MSNAEDFVIKNGVLEKYNGNTETVVIPAGVKEDIKSVTIIEHYYAAGEFAPERGEEFWRKAIPKEISLDDTDSVIDVVRNSFEGNIDSTIDFLENFGYWDACEFEGFIRTTVVLQTGAVQKKCEFSPI